MNVGFVASQDPERETIRTLMELSSHVDVILMSGTSIRLHPGTNFLILDHRQLELHLDRVLETIEQAGDLVPMGVLVSDIQDIATAAKRRLLDRGCIAFMTESELRDPDYVGNLLALARGVSYLAKPNRSFKMMVEHTQEVITVVDAQGKVTYENPAIESVLGYSQDELVGESAFDLIHPADRAAIHQQYLEEISSPSSGRSLRYRFKHANGEWKFLDSKAKRVSFSDKDFGFIVSSRDVTREVDALSALQVQQMQLAEAQKLAHIGSWRWDTKDSRLEWSDEMYRIYGMAVHSEVSFERFIQAVHPEDRPNVQDQITSALEKRSSCKFEHRVVRPDGEIRVLECHGQIHLGEEGMVLGMLGTGLDVTESWRSRKGLEASSSHFKALFDMSPEAVVVCNQEMKIVDINQAAIDLFDCDPDWMLNRDVFSLYAHDAKIKAGQDSESLGLQGQLSLNRTLQKASGNSFKAEIHLNTVSGLEQETTFLYIRDQTDRLKNESRLRRLGRHQETMLEKERERISREVHDVLGQMMTAIRLDVSWISTHLEDERTPRKLEEVSGRIMETISSIRRIAHDLRPGMLDDFGLSAAIEWNAKELCARSGLSLRVGNMENPDIPAELATTAFRVSQELITNVIRHAGAKELYLSVTAPGENLIISVQDDGRGMDVSSVEEKGSLGLMGIRERLFTWKGRLDLKSSPGKGTKAEVIIPLKNE